MPEMLRSGFDHPWCEEHPVAPADPPAELIDARELARRPKGLSRILVTSSPDGLVEEGARRLRAARGLTLE